MKWIALAVTLASLVSCSNQDEVGVVAAPTAEDVLLGKPYAGPSAPTPRGPDGKPLLTGYWKLLREARQTGRQSRRRTSRIAHCLTREKGKAALAYNIDETIDPEARCIITGIPRLLTSVLPFEILQTPERLGTFHYLSWHRWVWLDGRKPDADPDPRYLGNAIGRLGGRHARHRIDRLQGQRRRQVLAG